MAISRNFNTICAFRSYFFVDFLGKSINFAYLFEILQKSIYFPSVAERIHFEGKAQLLQTLIFVEKTLFLAIKK